jgi:hypothetical protein
VRQELTKAEWADFFISREWRALRAVVEDRLEAHRGGRENKRGEDIEQIAIYTIEADSRISEDKWLLYSLPEDLQKSRGEENVGGRNDENRRRAGHLEGIRARPGKDH